MTPEAAPFFTDVHPARVSGAAHWIKTDDGLRLRVGRWSPDAPRGTILMFPGRTEYVEKYAIVADEMAQRGFATLAIDWRGQGLADRMLDDPRTGHVNAFDDYQTDVQAMVAAARALALPEPWFLIGHSMGGCIGLRALYNDLPVAAAAFTGPMWGIRISPYLRPVAWALGRVMPVIGQGHRLPPTTDITPYVLAAPFEDNVLTTDREMFDMMRDQLRGHPELALGGPSFVWLRKALDETLELAQLPAPQVPCVTYLGDNERIVHVGRIEARMQSWPNGTLHVIPGGEHEVLMETPQIRTEIFDGLAAHFAAAG